MIKLISAPIRGLIRFPLVQFAIVFGLILWLQAADDHSISGRIFSGLDRLVEATVETISAILTIKSFTRSWLTFGFMIAYVYLAGLLILWLLRLLLIAAIDFVGRHNLLFLRNAIARERGIGAYRAWVPFERIRPPEIPQRDWEESFAWPANNKPPYPPLGHRLLRGILSYVVVVLGIALLLQFFTPFPVLTWIFGWTAAKPG
jgi:small-conductance mechanosensitive channel